MKKIIKTLMAAICLVAAVQAETVEAEYKVSFGILGEIGVAKAHMERGERNYRIEIEGISTGFAKALSRSRQEKQVSEGHVVNGILVPDRYSIIRSFANKTISKSYTIDHSKKMAVRLVEKKEDGKLVFREEKKLDFYAPNDLLTLYFNLAKLIPDKDRGAYYKFKAFGAEKQGGDVEVVVAGKETHSLYENDLGSGGYWYLTAIIHQKIFSSNRGELMLSVDKNGITKKAILKDVVLFGDIRAERVR
jgi:hypothetical protein